MAITQMAPEKAIQSWLKEYGGNNISAAYFLCDRHAHIPEKIALFYEDEKAKPLSGPSANFRTFHPKWPDSLNQLESKRGSRSDIVA